MLLTVFHIFDINHLSQRKGYNKKKSKVKIREKTEKEGKDKVF